MELACTHVGKYVAKQDYSGHHKATGNQRTPEKRYGERNVDSRFQEQLEEDGSGSIRQRAELMAHSSMQTSGPRFTGSYKEKSYELFTHDCQNIAHYSSQSHL